MRGFLGGDNRLGRFRPSADPLDARGSRSASGRASTTSNRPSHRRISHVGRSIPRREDVELVEEVGVVEQVSTCASTTRRERRGSVKMASRCSIMSSLVIGGMRARSASVAVAGSMAARRRHARAIVRGGGEQHSQALVALLANALGGPAEPLEMLGHERRKLREMAVAQEVVVHHRRQPHSAFRSCFALLRRIFAGGRHAESPAPFMRCAAVAGGCRSCARSSAR